MNFRTLRAARVQILTTPKELVMAVVHAGAEDLLVMEEEEPDIKVAPPYNSEGGCKLQAYRPECQSAHCIGGWQLTLATEEELAATLALRKVVEDFAEISPTPILDACLLVFDRVEYWQGETHPPFWVYFVADWPPDLRFQYLDAETHEQAAQAAAQAIDQFMAEAQAFANTLEVVPC